MAICVNKIIIYIICQLKDTFLNIESTIINGFILKILSSRIHSLDISSLYCCPF